MKESSVEIHLGDTCPCEFKDMSACDLIKESSCSLVERPSSRCHTESRSDPLTIDPLTRTRSKAAINIPQQTKPVVFGLEPKDRGSKTHPMPPRRSPTRLGMPGHQASLASVARFSASAERQISVNVDTCRFLLMPFALTCISKVRAEDPACANLQELGFTRTLCISPEQLGDWDVQVQSI